MVTAAHRGIDRRQSSAPGAGRTPEGRSELTQRRNDATRIEPISAAVTAEASVLSRALKCRALLFLFN
jgi:hypothetical protein